ncbi:MAG: hypothetical protein LBP85_10635 [Prevotellaceae bacterium]|jgi:hypothetical protein|nr:hypothetical protein [Prevotellaceae bacterium]
MEWKKKERITLKAVFLFERITGKPEIETAEDLYIFFYCIRATNGDYSASFSDFLAECEEKPELLADFIEQCTDSPPARYSIDTAPDGQTYIKTGGGIS